MIGQIPKNAVLIIFSEIPDYLSLLFWDKIDMPACMALLQSKGPHIAQISHNRHYRRWRIFSRQHTSSAPTKTPNTQMLFCQ